MEKRRSNKRDGFERNGQAARFCGVDWSIVQDDRGRVLGKVKSQSPLLVADMQVVKEFLIEIQKEKLNMSKQQTDKITDKCNMVFLAGVIKTMKVRDDGSAFILVDPSGDTKYIPCTVHDDKQLAGIVARFRVEDVIQIRGMVRSWSQKKGETWENKTEIRITTIANQPPARPAMTQDGGDDSGGGFPF